MTSDESSDQPSENSGNEIQIEFPLIEEFQDSVEVLLLKAPPLVMAMEMNNQETRLSLPAALCDDRLLEELKSIPNKMGFKIGEVADMLGIKQYVLRYWESEFDVLKPKKASNNQRYYTRKDVENAYLIRKLLHRDRFSIEGARAALRDLKTFVKKETRKDKDWSHFQGKFDSLHDRVDSLVIEIRSLKRLFA